MKNSLRITVLSLMLVHQAVAQTQTTPVPLSPAPLSRVQTPTPTNKPFTGAYLTTFNASTLGRPAPSLNQKLNLDYALPHGNGLDLRIEAYTEGSYNADLPGQLVRNVNEPKLEVQLTYKTPLTPRFSLSGALLHHDNFRYADTYYWAIATATYILPVSKALTLTTNFSAQKRLKGGRLFGDFAGTLDDGFAQGWTVEANYHRYENYGEYDLEPTEKEELEYGIIRQLPENRTVALSFFRHIQHDSPNDQFSFLHLKYGISF